MKNLSLSDLRVLIDELAKLVDKTDGCARIARKEADPQYRQFYLTQAEAYRRSLSAAQEELDNRIQTIHKEISLN